MLGRRQRTRVPTSAKGVLSDASPDEDDEYYDDAEGADAEWGDSDETDDDWDDSDDVEGEWDEEEAAEADHVDDETDDYDDDPDQADEYDDEAGDEEDADQVRKPFTPPTFLEAARQAFRPNRPTIAGGGNGGRSSQTDIPSAAGTAGARRARAQPATGDEEDAKAVNLIDRREQTVGFVLGFGLILLSLLAYTTDRHYKNKDLVKQLAVRHAAVEVLAIFALLGVLCLLATFFKRRALIGFFLTFSGLALLQTLGLFGIIYLGGGGWLIFRAMQRSPRSRARQAALAEKSGGAGASTGGTGRRRSTAGAGGSTTSTSSGTGTPGTRSTGSTAQRQIGRNNRTGGGARTAGSRGAPSSSGRYTPPKQTRRPPPAKQPEPAEPSNRLTAWLRK
jgi:hypothetical protein